MQLAGLVISLQTSLIARIVGRLTPAYWPRLLWIAGLAVYALPIRLIALLLDWLTGLVNCSLLIRLIVSYWPDYLRLTGRVYWPDYLRLIELAYFGLLA